MTRKERLSEAQRAHISRGAGFAPARVRDISEKVYRERLGPDGVRRVIEKADGDERVIRRTAASYDSLTRSYMRVLLDKEKQG